MRRFMQQSVIRQHEIRVGYRDKNDPQRGLQPRTKPQQSNRRDNVEQHEGDIKPIRNGHPFGSIDSDRIPNSRFQLGEAFCGVHEINLFMRMQVRLASLQCSRRESDSQRCRPSEDCRTPGATVESHRALRISCPGERRGVSPPSFSDVLRLVQNEIRSLPGVAQR